MKENKSVIDHLDSIERTLEDGGRSIHVSKLIGEDFFAYFRSSTPYLYESDERKFEREKKKKLKGAIIALLLCLIPSIVHIILSIYLGQPFWLNFIGDLLCLAFPILVLVYFAKMPRKRLADSKYALKRIRFYTVENRFCNEEAKGVLSTISSLLFYLSLAVCTGCTIGQYLLVRTNDNLLLMLFAEFGGFMLIYLPSLSLKILFSDYSYPAWVFEKEDSYVIAEYDEWKKVIKDKVN